MLGSIPQLPAETCKEIKASEGGEAVSGKYWFDSIIPGKTVLAHCDMENEGNEGGGGRGGGTGMGELGGFETWKIFDIALFPMLEMEKGYTKCR